MVKPLDPKSERVRRAAEMLDEAPRETRRDPPQGGGWIGFVFGLAVGCLLSLGLVFGRHWLRHDLDPSVWLLVLPVICALLGARYGDRFWHWLSGIFRFWY